MKVIYMSINLKFGPMKVFLFTVGNYRYAVSGSTQSEARAYLVEYTSCEHLESAEVTEIPESEWDNPIIDYVVFNENTKQDETLKLTIREVLEGESSPYIIYTNDNDLF